MKWVNPHQYVKKYKIGPYSWSELELMDLLKAWIAISVAFAIVLSGAKFGSQLINMFIVSALTVGVGFVLHEMGHKIMAQQYGAWAEFRADYTMLVLAVIMSFFGFVFAAPGAVMIASRVSIKKYGKIALAGPVVNIVLALIFLGLSFVFQNTIVFYGYLINSWLALFNMIPFGFFDGAKILKWDKIAYGVIVGISALLVFFPQVIRG